MTEKAFKIFNQFMSSPVKRNEGVDYHFVFNNGDVDRFEFPLPQNLEDAIISKLYSKKYGYSTPKGNSGVRKKIAQYEKAKGYNESITKKNICLTTGVTNGLHLVLNYIFDNQNHDEIIIPIPSYPTIWQIANIKGVDVKKISTERENKFLPTIDDFTDNITDKSKAIILTSPNNPTGTEYSEEMINQIYNLCRDEEIYLIIDEIFSGLMLNGNKHPTPTYDCNDNTLIRVNGWSKDRGTAGFRIGYIVASPDIINKIGDEISSSYGNPPTLFNNFISKDMTMRRFMLESHKIPEELTEEFEEYKRVIEENIKKYEQNNMMIHEILGSVPSITDIIETEGGFCKYIKFNTDKDDVNFAKELYQNTGVLLTPGSGFNSLENGWMRLTFSLPHSRLEKGLYAIKNYLC